MTIIFNLLLFLSLPLLLSATALPPPSTANASHILKLHGGYSLSAIYLATSSASSMWNGTGTILALPDFVFSALHRPSLSLLSHSLKQRLTRQDLTASAAQELPTWQSNHCLLLSKGSNNEAAIRNSISAIKIIHPDIYMDDHLVIHGIDSVLDPSFIPECSFSDPTVETQFLTARSTFLDRAAWFLRRKGFSVVAAALNAKKPHLLKLPAVTIFATSDNHLFSEHNGFHYNFLRHVAPKQYQLDDIAGLTAIESLLPGKMITVGPVDLSEIYHNRWIVVIEITHRLDNAGKFYGEGEGKDVAGAFSPAPSGKGDNESPLPVAVGVYGEEDELEEWQQSPTPTTEKKLCKPADYLSCPAGVKESDLAKSEPFVSEKLVESAPSHQMNKARETVVELRPLDESVTRRLSEGSTVDNGRCRLISPRIMNEAGEQAVDLAKSTIDIAQSRLGSSQSGKSGVYT